MYLYPDPDAIPLEEVAASLRHEAITLVVPDGNWRQAAKVRRRERGLAELRCVSLPEAAPSRYRLRTEVHDHAVSTIEAIARALAIVEADPELEQRLLHPFRAMVERTLWSRGRLDARHVTGGIPVGAERHDPSSGLS